MVLIIAPTTCLLYTSILSLFVVNAERCCAGGRQLYQNQHSEQAEDLIVEPVSYTHLVDQKFLDEIVHLLGLEDKLKNMPNNLSGGQQQRVAIARALITKPAIVLADEPTGNLDSKTSAEVLGLIKRTSAEFRQTVVMITHNDDIARLAEMCIRDRSY